MKHLRRFPEVFTVRDDGDHGTMGKGWVTLHELLQSPRERTDAIESVLRTLEIEGLVPGWRNEVPSNQQLFFKFKSIYNIAISTLVP